jgi:hypothetical protein
LFTPWLAHVRAYVDDLKRPPLPLERRQTLFLAAILAIIAISRWLALSASQLDWDESLFIGGVRHYDVIAQHPHPPGYPLFIFFAKIARLAAGDDFRSLQAIVALSSLLLFPATFFLLREMRFGFRMAVSAALITTFLPTVWYYGGTALSDIPALTAIVAASASFLAGGRNPRLWSAGMLLASIAAGIRPLHVIIAAVPAIAGALAMRRPRAIAAGCAIFVAVIAASYAGAAMATPNPPWGYLQQIGLTAHHIGSTDSFNNVTRPPLWKLVSMFFVRSHRGGRTGILLLVLAIIGAIVSIVRRSVAIWIVLAMFAPIAIVSWMMFDLTAVTRYGLAYAMLYSILSAYAIDTLARRWSPAVVAIVVVSLIVWTWPALALVRHQPSPPVAAMRWIRAHVPPSRSHLYIDDSLGYHAGPELPGYDNHFFNAYDEIPPDAYAAGNYCLVDRLTIQPHALFFQFPRQRLAEVARDIYFETSVIPMDAMVRFGEGWYQDEYDGPREHAWRWMQQTSTTLLPPVGKSGLLVLRFHIPLNSLPRPPKMTLMWNRAEIEQKIVSELDNERRYILPSRTDGPNECRIVLDEAAHTKDDPREFGLQLTGVSWDRVERLR